MTIALRGRFGSACRWAVSTLFTKGPTAPKEGPPKAGVMASRSGEEPGRMAASHVLRAVQQVVSQRRWRDLRDGGARERPGSGRTMSGKPVPLSDATYP